MHLIRNLNPFLLWCILAGALTAGLSRGQAEEGRPVLKTFGIREIGNEEATCWSSTQDERGVMYFGSNEVNSYDGERWKRYPVPGTGVIRGLAVGETGRLWIGALNEIGYFDRQASGDLGPYHSLVALLPPGHRQLGDVWHAFAHAGGAVFVTSDTVLLWDGKSFNVHSMPGSRRLPSFQVGGAIYIDHRASGLWSLEGKDRDLKPTNLRLPQTGALWMEPQKSGWFIVSPAGLIEYTDGAAAILPGEATEFLRKSVVTGACRSSGEHISVGTYSGLALIDGSGALKRVLGQDDGLPSRSVLSQFVAQDGLLWITSGAGIARLAMAGVTVFDRKDGMLGRPCLGISQDGDRILVSTDDGVFSLDTRSPAAARFEPVTSLPGRYVDLAPSTDGLLAAGYKGIYRVSPAGGIAHVFATKMDAILLSPSALEPNTYLVADNFDLRRLLPAGDGAMSSTLVAKLPDLAISVAEDNAGMIWAGTFSRGAYRLGRTPETEPEPVPFGGAPWIGRTLVGRVGDSIVVATSKGSELHPPGELHPLRLASVPATDPLAMSNPDSDGRLWIAFASPFADGSRVPLLGRLSLKDGEAQWQPFAVPGLENLGSLTRLFVDRRGILWVGGMEALLRVDPARLQPIGAPRTPLISASVAAGAQVPPDENAFTFQFSAVEYGRREALRFQTRLSEKAAWSAPTNDSQLTLAGLRDSDYTFAVRVINDVGMTSPSATWHFTVLPPWYRTRTAFAAWIVLAVAGFIGGIHWRSAYLQRQNLRLEALVRKKTEQLEQANAAKSEFLANMSHEIRNPISGIVGLSLAIEETPLTERQQQIADSIRSCAALLATLVDDVIDFSKIEAGKIELRSAPFDLRASLEQCGAMVAEEARTTGTTLRIDFSPDVPARVVGDSARVQQIVLNYLTNAVKFSAGKPVVIGAATAGTDRVRLYVRDQGPGVSAAEAATLFTKFTRLDRARSRNIRGSGLGLAVCRLLATKMGGSVGVESQLLQGSCFWTELPLPDAEAVPVSTAVVAADIPPLHALIVEDIAYNATAMQAVLRKLGVSSDVAGNGLTALEMLQSNCYDIAFMDWNLPDMIGTEVVARYRALEPPDRRTIIIATTAYSAALNREACLQAGMDAFIAKPFTPDKISAALRDLRGSLRAAASVEVSHRPAPETPPVAEIDLQLLNVLGEETPAGLAAQIDQYLASFEAERAAARAVIPGGDAKEIHRVAHRLSSHASMVKFEPLTELAGQLQAIAATADAERLNRVFADFEAEFARFRNKLDSIRASLALG